MEKSGKEFNDSFSSLFYQQTEFQTNVTGIPAPIDNTEWFKYHVAAMMEEMGEVLKADKRWKTHRNATYNPENKLEEIADVFITAMNLAIFSGFSAKMVWDAISAKISENTLKLEEARKNDSNR